MFDPVLQTATPAHRKVYGTYERVLTVIDLAAALSFVIGSALFFAPSLVTVGTWFFLVGSAFFATRPCLRFMREFHLGRLPLSGDMGH